ncbi:aspartyl aminopeptidase [Trifolium pratense]|uniref:Aspartyl aminopeptidase n=2 Tax=Trifolium TaxID=3898 RepID=A0A2K3KYE3_TRIPR|nr:aspartyl aminopeptidase [Trifolium pratense]
MVISAPTLLEKAVQRSFLVSADMAHALHPNYMDRHEENHQPKLHGGLVIKQNANQRYATNAVTSFIFREIASKHNLPVQDFVVRNDMGCGSTIGPILASGVGIRTVDVGAPQLSMHSIREMCAVDDVKYSYEHFKAFFQEFFHLDANIVVDI